MNVCVFAFNGRVIFGTGAEDVVIGDRIVGLG